MAVPPAMEKHPMTPELGEEGCAEEPIGEGGKRGVVGLTPQNQAGVEGRKLRWVGVISPDT